MNIRNRRQLVAQQHIAQQLVGQQLVKLRLVTLFVSLLLLTQFGVVVHAADHAFHDEDVLCLTYSNAEQNKSLQTGISSIVIVSLAFSDIVVHADDSVDISFHSDYQSRAPPTITI